MLKQLIKKAIPTPLLNRYYYPYRWAQRNYKTLTREYNQLQSMREWKCVGKHGAPLPWYTYPCIEYLSNLNFSEKEIFHDSFGNRSISFCTEPLAVNPVSEEQLKHSL